MNLSGQTQRGLILFDQGRYAEAESFFRDALSSDPHDSYTIHLLALCQLNQDLRLDALESIDQALHLEPECPAYLAIRALMLMGIGRQSDAVAASDDAVRLDPDSAYVFQLRAKTLAMQRNWQGAEKAARRALALDPENTSASIQLARALLKQKRLAESHDQAQALLTLEPDTALHQEAAGWIAFRRSDYRAARRHFREALRLDPNIPSVRDGLLRSIKAKLPPYRLYLRYSYFKESARVEWAVLSAILLILLICSKGYALIAIPMVAVFGFMLFSVVKPFLPALANTIVLLDPTARHLLSRDEAWTARTAPPALFLSIACFGTSVSLIPSTLLATASAFYLISAYSFLGSFSDDETEFIRYSCRAAAILTSAIAAMGTVLALLRSL